MNIVSRVLNNLGLSGFLGKLIAALGIITSAIFLYTAYEGSFPTFTQRGLLLVLCIPVIFLLASLKKKDRFGRWRDLAMAVISPIPFVYIILIQDELMMRGGMPNTLDTIMGMQRTRRSPRCVKVGKDPS